MSDPETDTSSACKFSVKAKILQSGAIGHNWAGLIYVQSGSKLLAHHQFFHQIVKPSQARVEFDGLSIPGSKHAQFDHPKVGPGYKTQDKSLNVFRY